MVQMTARDQQIVKGIPGNDKCCDCGMKSPQWASVSFGNVFCLECSGVHRSLGVHISFVRSIAMDSWTDQQLALMKTGGNDKCNQYLQAKGITSQTPIKQKYESDAAQLYKQVLKARVEGKPEPTVLTKPPPKKPYQPQTGPNAVGGAGAGGSNDANGMERLAGETDQQYIARQTRLREDAKARMRAKFGGSGGLGGSSGGGSGMQGIGSDPNYNPNGGGAGDPVESIMTGLGSMMGAAGSLARNVASEQNVQAIKTTGASFWGSFAGGVSNVASSLTDPNGGGGMDGLASLQREAASHKPSQSKYGGFGSDQATMGGNNQRTTSAGSMNSNTNSAPSSGGSGALQEAPGLPGEDRNGIERLTGESDAQYVVRQTRLRDEARARMAAKFGGGGGGMGGVGSSSAPPSGNHVAAAPGSGNSFGSAPRATSNSSFGSSPARPAAAAKPAADFFSSFGS